MVEWSGPAKKDLKQIHDYIAQDSKYYAKNVVRNIVQNESLSWKADAAFRQAAKKVIQRAKETATPVVVWEAGQVKEILPDQVEKRMFAMEDEAARR